MNYTDNKPWLPERRMAQAILDHLGAAGFCIEVEDIIRTVRMPCEDQQLWDGLPWGLRVRLAETVCAVFCIDVTYTFEEDSDDDDLWYSAHDRAEEAIDAVGVCFNSSKVGAA